MELRSFFLLGAGFLALLFGGDGLVRHSARFASLVGLSPLVIGLTIVAFGTSAPELAVSVAAGVSGNADVAVGNVVGSNIFNVLFVLGACAAVSPLFVGRVLAWIDLPIMLVATLLVPVFALDRNLARLEGAALVLLLAAYAWYVVRRERRAAARGGDAPPPPPPPPDARRARIASLVWIVASLAVLVLGSRWFVTGAVELAAALGVSELVIGLTIVATGTSLPEVVTSIVATLRGQREIAAGNVVGSNVFNVLGVLGATSMAHGGVVVTERVVAIDAPIMVAVSLVLLAAVARGLRIGRTQGLLFLAGYAAYTAWIVLDASRSAALPQFERALLWYALPVAAVVFLATLGRSRRAPGP